MPDDDAHDPSPRDPLALIADPLRLRVVRCLEERGRASLPELAADAGVHPNTLRPHLVELQEVGLLLTERRLLRAGRGRPGIDYRLSPLWDRTRANFVGVAELLAAALERADPDAEQLHAVGNEWGRYLLGRPGSRDIAAELPRVLGELGYEATVEGDRLELARCPCPTVAPGSPELVCLLTEGVVAGALAAAGGTRAASDFEHDTARRCCRARLAAVE